MERPAVVIDNGTGYTKLGFSGNLEPGFIIPTCISQQSEKLTISKTINQDEFYVGDEAIKKSFTNNLQLSRPVYQGQIENWADMEKFWLHSVYSLLRCDPEQHTFVLTEPPMNTPENREQMAEIMFETFNIPGLYIGVQAVLALYAQEQCFGVQEESLTGLVLDSGEGLTHCIPVAHGYVISSCIKHIPIAGYDITNFIQRTLINKKVNIPREDLQETSRQIKEKYCYVTKNYQSEYSYYGSSPPEGKKTKIKKYVYNNPRSNQTINIPIAEERFQAPELFFKPQFLGNEWKTPLDEVVDSSIQACPIDTRKALYKNVLLSGGTSMFRGFDKRLQTGIKERVDARYQNILKTVKNVNIQPTEVKVVKLPTQRYSAWLGASIMASQNNFIDFCITKQKYSEFGPSIARQNVVFQSGM